MIQIGVEDLDGYRGSRQLAPSTSAKELQILRQFFAFCLERQWLDLQPGIENNPAKRIKLPKNIKPEPVVPYTVTELAQIRGACDAIGHSPYEHLRARGMVLLMRYTGLRISDVATLERDRAKDGQILLHTQKTGESVFLPIPAELQESLNTLPLPRGASSNCPYFFWNGTMAKAALVSSAERTLRSVFRHARVKHAHAHRFRHTLATDILAKGGTEQDAADVLGISPAVVRKHYAKWSQARQERITRIFGEVFRGTKMVHGGNPPAERVN
jgi:integrase/recombinase XerC